MAAKDVDWHGMTPEAARAKPASLAWNDPFLIDQLLTEEERMIRDTAHANCQDKLKPRELEGNRHEVFHREILPEMARLAFCA